MKTNNIIQLSDGKKLCFAEYGDPKGDPIFLFHGNPGSRISWGLYPDSPFLQNIRIIAPSGGGPYALACARRDPLSLFKAFRNLELSEYDKSIADKEEIQNVFTYVFPESYLQNGIGSAYDVTLPKDLSNSELISLPGVGHLWIMEHVKEVLEKLINV